MLMGPTQDIDEDSGDETAESLELQVNNFQKFPFCSPFFRKIWLIFFYTAVSLLAILVVKFQVREYKIR